jgi:hypothetical protein
LYHFCGKAKKVEASSAAVTRKSLGSTGGLKF